MLQIIPIPQTTPTPSIVIIDRAIAWIKRQEQPAPPPPPILH